MDQHKSFPTVGMVLKYHAQWCENQYLLVPQVSEVTDIHSWCKVSCICPQSTPCSDRPLPALTQVQTPACSDSRLLATEGGRQKVNLTRGFRSEYVTLV